MIKYDKAIVFVLTTTLRGNNNTHFIELFSHGLINYAKILTSIKSTTVFTTGKAILRPI